MKISYNTRHQPQFTLQINFFSIDHKTRPIIIDHQRAAALYDSQKLAKKHWIATIHDQEETRSNWALIVSWANAKTASTHDRLTGEKNIIFVFLLHLLLQHYHHRHTSDARRVYLVFVWRDAAALFTFLFCFVLFFSASTIYTPSLDETDNCGGCGENEKQNFCFSHCWRIFWFAQISALKKKMLQMEFPTSLRELLVVSIKWTQTSLQDPNDQCYEP